MTGQVTLTLDRTVATVLLDRPDKHNALTPAMLQQLERILIDLDADRAVRVVIIAAAGTRSFCAGADIKLFKALPPLDMWAGWTRTGLRVFDLLAGLRQPTIAAIHGNAYGGGFELALACDLRVLSEEATLGLTEVGLGTVPGWGGTGRLPAAIGAARAKELIFTGTPLSAVQAAGCGLVNRIVPTDQVHATAVELAERIAGRAPIAVQMAKQAIDSGPAYRLMEPLASAATAYTDDAVEGFAAFQERRDPTFHGA
ncbi:enoyl-CoA hydratase-related protein [Actinoplanes sp. NBRC 101535]|uniref:enoyl-CoA hydratase/isomerase family protein n=1 Tax=Actinoplanes sp. NBRC 101535 TaxID=3032196 RepID=UPI0024A14EC6|nr:enoyl-CoA hydratase-related protein [Actinoplanes sp. NBRC 101535]GLY02392.1 enoyl-CoA hydratase [Actinoplanes sp. NBRC 101535]